MDRGGGRIYSIDAVRGLAIVLMVFSHGLNWFHVEGSHAIFSLGALSLGDAATPLFFVIAGVALALSLTARRRTGASEDETWRGYAKRFRQLFILGIPISFAWGVLQAQAVTLGLLVLAGLYVFERRPTVGPAPWAFIGAAVAAAIHGFVVRLDIASPVLHLLLQGQFPAFAIMALVAFGFGAGTMLRSGTPWRLRFFLTGIAFAGVGFVLARLPATAADAPGGGMFIRADMPLPYVCFGLASTLLLTATLDLPFLRGRTATRLLARIGRHGLFLYLAHYGLILLQAGLFGWWHALETAAAVAASLLLVFMTGFIGLRYEIDARTIYGRMDAVARWWSARDDVSPGPSMDVPSAPVPEPELLRSATHTAQLLADRSFR